MLRHEVVRQVVVVVVVRAHLHLHLHLRAHLWCGRGAARREGVADGSERRLAAVARGESRAGLREQVEQAAVVLELAPGVRGHGQDFKVEARPGHRAARPVSHRYR